MKSARKKASVPFFFLLSGWLALVLFSACEKTEGEGGGGLEPGRGSPEILEGFFCGYVFEGNPEAIDNSFFPDENIYLWLSWGQVSGKHEVRIIWLDPEGDVVTETAQQFNSKTGKWITFFFIDTTSSAPLGRWIAEVNIDDQFIRSYAFWMLEG